MKTLEVFDPAMCCSTGVCGPSVDPVLARFTADLDWLKTNKVGVVRHNLSQEPQAFAANRSVSAALKKEGAKSLPIILVDGKIVSRRKYPSRSQLAAWAGVKALAERPAPSAPCCAPSKGDKRSKSCC